MASSSASKSWAIPPASSPTVSFVAMRVALSESGLGLFFLRQFEMSEQQQRHRLQQALHAAGLLQKRFVGPQRHLLLEQAIAESGEVEHLDARRGEAKPPRQLVARH